MALKLTAKITLNGERSTAFASGFRPAIRLSGEAEFHSVVLDFQGEMQGTDSKVVEIQALAPETWSAISSGDEFELMEGAKTIAQGVFISV